MWNEKNEEKYQRTQTISANMKPVRSQMVVWAFMCHWVRSENIALFKLHDAFLIREAVQKNGIFSILGPLVPNWDNLIAWFSFEMKHFLLGNTIFKIVKNGHKKFNICYIRAWPTNPLFFSLNARPPLPNVKKVTLQVRCLPHIWANVSKYTIFLRGRPP